MKVAAFGGLLGLVLSVYTSAQINLSYVSGFSKNSGYTTKVTIDSLLIDSKVNSGSAHTRLTFVLTPGANNYYTTSGYSQPLDSIEMSLSFQLPTDFAVDSLYLWIDGKPVAGQIQDRALASAQYQQIVGIRRDPALLEFSGNGYYNLRIFPAKSFQSRKISIDFHHTFDDDSADVITASVPVVFDSLYSYSGYYKDTASLHIGYAEATFFTMDKSEYNVQFPGLGKGSFRILHPLTLTASKIAKLGGGTISTADVSGPDEFLWMAKDRNNGKLSAGLTVDIADSTVLFKPEPKTRIIVLDIKKRIWNWNDYYSARSKALGYSYTNSSYYTDADIWARAQKFAILCLESYIGENDKFNIVFSGAVPKALFENPVSGHAEYIKRAVEAILKAAPASESSSLDIIKKASLQADSGVVIYISDIFQPYNYYDKNYITITDEGKSYDRYLDSIGSAIKASGVTLFTVDGDSRISQVSYESGGYRIAELLNGFNIDYKYEIIDGRRLMIPIMPPLFGNRNNSGIRDIKVNCSGLDDVVFTTDGYNYNWWTGGIRITPIMREPVMLLDKMRLPSYNISSALLRIAGQKNSNPESNVNFVITGKMGGLKFTKTVTARPMDGAITKLFGDVSWAFRKSEFLADGKYITNTDAIKTMGKNYHIITRQTSLLALEPGMKLWEDTIVPKPGVDIVTASSTLRATTAMADMSYSALEGAPTGNTGTGTSLDGISLESLALRKGVAVLEVPQKLLTADFSVKGIQGGLLIRLPQFTNECTIQIFDLKGRQVALKRLAANSVSGTSVLWNFSTDNLRLCTGYYTIQITAENQKKVFKVPMVNR